MDSSQSDLKNMYLEPQLRKAIYDSLSNMGKFALKDLIMHILIGPLKSDRQSVFKGDEDTRNWADNLISVFEDEPEDLFSLMNKICKAKPVIAQKITERYSKQDIDQASPANRDIENPHNTIASDEVGIGDADFDNWYDSNQFKPEDCKWNTTIDKRDMIDDNQVKNINCTDLLIVTASCVERDSVLRLLKPYPDQIKVLELQGNPVCYFGRFGAYTAVVIMCDFRDVINTYNQINEIERIYKTRVAIMVGIACGRSGRTQRIGDILISSALIPYDSKRINPDGKTKYTDYERPINQDLQNLFTSQHEWTFKRPDNYQCKVHPPGFILTGSVLNNGLTEKVKIFRDFEHRTPIGLEMEGKSLYDASDKNNVPCILIKAISDWGNGEKDKDEATDRPYRKLAAAAAASFVHCKLQDKNALAAFKRKP